MGCSSSRRRRRLCILDEEGETAHAGTSSAVISRLAMGLGERLIDRRGTPLSGELGGVGGLKNGLCESMITICPPSSSSMMIVGIMGLGVGSSSQSSKTDLGGDSGRSDGLGGGGESQISVSSALLQEEDSWSLSP